MAPRELPTWKSPKPTTTVTENNGLKILNSLTKSKDLFHPIDSNLVKWYNCGPTVYDHAHLGHARLYITIDVLRRIIRDYFGYDLMFVMNITDVDDKIIVRARENHLFEKYFETENQYKKDLEEAVALFESLNDVNKIVDPKLATYQLAKKTILKEKVTKEDVFENRDMYVFWLDKTKGKEVVDYLIFKKLSSYYEKDFLDDMKSLNVQQPDIITRVSEYISEIVEFVQKIIENGYAYETNNSVYFNTKKFNESPNHYYAKIKPNALNDNKLIQENEEAEGSLITKDKKINVQDFALWKKSKEGEPYWPSPWGNGRPGWHIECSAMATSILGNNMDIHSGGIDLAFPHHDNELAQSEAHSNTSQWVNYFIHVGHLHIDGCKMSKSLKNFITIKEALKKYSQKELRISFLMHQYNSPMDFKNEIVTEAKKFIRNLDNFLANTQALIKESLSNDDINKHNYNEQEKKLVNYVNLKKDEVHNALKDNFNTPLVLKELSNIIQETNKYINSKPPNHFVLSYIRNYITKITDIFGLTTPTESNIKSGDDDNDEKLELAKIISGFRDEIRKIAIQNKDKNVLEICDSLRNNQLRNKGIILDDRNDGSPALVKIIDKEQLEIQNEQIREEKKEKEKKLLKMKEEALKKKLQKEKTEKIDPSKMFLENKDFSKFDTNGIPTHLKDGEPLPKSRLKKIMKEYTKQKELFEAYQLKKGGK